MSVSSNIRYAGAMIRQMLVPVVGKQLSCQNP